MDTIRTTLGHDGRVVIPEFFRSYYGLAVGDSIEMRCDASGIHITTPEINFESLQSGDDPTSVVASFIAERWNGNLVMEE